VARGSVEQTMTSVRHQERAYVALKDVQGERTIRELQIVRFTFVLANVGNTPAYKLRFGVLMRMSQTRPTPDEIDSHLHLAQEVGVIAPTLDIRIEGDSNEAGQPIVLTTQAIADLNNRRAFFSICGKITYEDVFGTSHDTRFALHYDAEAHRFHLAPLKQISLKICSNSDARTSAIRREDSLGSHTPQSWPRSPASLSNQRHPHEQSTKESRFIFPYGS
jgi:hypothetical protein